MHLPSKKVGPLDKVQLKISAQPLAPGTDGATANHDISVIYGIGAGGITPFESVLFDRVPGDETTVRIEPGQSAEFFGHLLCTLTPYLPKAQSYDLSIAIQSVEPAQGHEVVKGMAQAVGCGSGCDCGCGCD